MSRRAKQAMRLSAVVLTTAAFFIGAVEGAEEKSAAKKGDEAAVRAELARSEAELKAAQARRRALEEKLRKMKNKTAVEAEALNRYEAELKRKKAREERLAALVEQLSDDDMTKRDAAERELRLAGKEAVPLLKVAHPEKADALRRVRSLLVQLTVAGSGIDEKSANELMVLGRDEALAKRWGNAKRCYRRAEKIYDKLKDDADDRKDRAAEQRFKGLQKTADRRADRAGHLEKGRGFSGLNLGIVKIGVKHDIENQDDW